MSARTGFLDALSNARQRSSVSRSHTGAFRYSCRPLRNAASPKYAESMRMTAAPFEYETTSKISEIARVVYLNFYSMRIFSASKESARVLLIDESIPNIPLRKNRVVRRIPCTGEAFVQQGVHHSMVTRLPNHWCAGSCA